jgi:hypothetical protein
MTRKGEAHEALSLLFAWKGVPIKMIIDNIRMKSGELAQKRQGGTFLLVDHHSPWSNFAKCEIRDLEKGAAWKLTHSGGPRWLWCFAMEHDS